MRITPLIFAILMVLSVIALLSLPSSLKSEFLFIIPLIFFIGFLKTWG
jgi:hypothetical protein